MASYRLKNIHFFVVCLVFTLLVGGILVQRLYQQRQQVQQAAMAQMQRSFGDAVLLVKLAWQLQGRPQQLQWGQLPLPVSPQGWPQPPQGDCRRLWLALMGRTPEVLALPLDIASVSGQCRYRLGDSAFGYWPASGQVEEQQSA